MPLRFDVPLGFKHMIFVNEFQDRRIVFCIQGVCTVYECFAFINRYPTIPIAEADNHLIPVTTDIFENEVEVRVRAFSTSYPGQMLPTWLNYMTDKHGGIMRFTDPYTFHIDKHMMMSKTGEDMRAPLA